MIGGDISMKSLSHRKALLSLGLAVLTSGCSGESSSEIDGMNAVYTAEAPDAVAAGAQSDEPIELQIIEVKGAVVELE